MHWLQQSKVPRLFADDGAEQKFRQGLEAVGAGSATNVRTVAFDGIDPGRIGEALGCMRAGIPVLLASRSWGTWTWREVERLAEVAVDPGSVLIRTGGSSGQAKFAIHTLESLEAAALQLCKRLGGGPVSSVVELPLQHVSGWMPILRALVSGGRLGLPGQSNDLPGTVCRSVVPTTLFRAFGDEGRLAELRAANRVFAGAAPFSDDLLARARREKIRLSPVYGMTETAAMVALQDPEEFLDGAGLSLRPFGVNEVQVEETGEIRIRTPQLFSGYWGREAVSKEGGWWRTGDLGERDGGAFRPLGRMGRFVDSGGETVSLERVEEAVRTIGGIEDFWLGTLPDEEWGARLVLFLVSRHECDWRKELKSRLDPGEVPAEIRVVEKLPRTAAGKIDPDRLFG